MVILPAILSPPYPSGHTTSTAIIVVALLVLTASVAARLLALVVGVPYVLAVAASRVYLGCHFPLDLAGAFLCALAAAFIVTGLAALPVVRAYLDRLGPAGGPPVRAAAEAAPSRQGFPQARWKTLCAMPGGLARRLWVTAGSCA